MKLNHPIKKIKLSIRAISVIDNWWDYFLDYLGLKNKEVIYKIKGKKIETRAKTIDKSIFTEVVLEELYFPKWLKLKENPLIIDIGSHIGLFSIASELKFKNPQIYAIEPNKENFEILCKQISANNSNIKAFKLALADKIGKMKLYSGEHSARGSLIREEGENFEIVDTMSLKEFFEKNKINKCDLMKIDIEGGEYEVFYSTPKEIFEKIKRIFLELHKIPGESKEELMDFLRKNGFKLNFKEDDFIYAVKEESY